MFKPFLTALFLCLHNAVYSLMSTPLLRPQKELFSENNSIVVIIKDLSQTSECIWFLNFI